MSEKNNKTELKDEDLEKAAGGNGKSEKPWYVDYGYSSVFEDMIACPNESCGSYHTLYYYRASPHRCVKIECKDCGYLLVNENGI